MAYLEGRESAKHIVRMPGKPVALRLRADESGKRLAADGADALFLYAEVVDAQGTLVPVNQGGVRFTARGPARIVGDHPAPVEAGVAGVLPQSKHGGGENHHRRRSPGANPRS